MFEIARKKIAEIFDVKPRHVKMIEKLTGGLSNHVFLIQVKKKKYTFRIPGKNADKIVNRAAEYDAICKIEPLKINTPVLYFDVTTGYKLSEYSEGKSILEEDKKSYLGQIASVLHKLHDAQIDTFYNYDHLNRLSCYEDLVIEEGYNEDRERYKQLKELFLDNMDFLSQFKHVLCHGDSQVSNYVKTPFKMLLLDWEFSAKNDPFYDVACFGNNDFNDALKLLPVYLGKEPTEKDYKRLYLWRSFQCLQWHNVALYKELIGLSAELNVPFGSIAEGYLDKANHFLTCAVKYKLT